MGFSLDDADKMLAGIFAPWVFDLGLKTLGLDDTGGRFLLPANDRLVHVGGVICGQATPIPAPSWPSPPSTAGSVIARPSTCR